MSYSKSKPSNYVTKEQIERARNVDMVEFLERTEGFSVKKRVTATVAMFTTAFLLQTTEKGGIGTAVTRAAITLLRFV